jgi:serine/threonine-protein kinase
VTNRFDSAVTTLVSADAAGFQPGRIVGDRYRIVSLLGRGAMGEVYRADDLKIGQQVALKFLPLHFAADVTRVSRFVDEVRLARQIAHPNVCRVYDIGEADRHHFLSMEYIDGEDLATLLPRIGRLGPEKVLDIARQLCAGLAAAHDQGVLHRDLKPANIMIDGRGHARITDFGLAITAHRSSSGEIAGTPAYMAPEQIFGGTLGPQTDLFALGLILGELLSGKRLIQDATLQQRISQREGHDLTRSIPADVDPALQQIIARCLESDPARRPLSARSVAAVLPGGADPLVAALAAGMIPSPEMVAAVETDGLRPAAAAACFALAIVGLAVAAWNTEPMMLHRTVTLTKPPEALVERAQQIVAEMGVQEGAFDSAFWFETTQTHSELAAERSALYEPFMRASRPSERSGLIFVYRQSPQFLVPENTFGVVAYREPAADVAGMADVTLDPLGRLRRFTAVPASIRGSPAAGMPDWSRAFAQAGLELNAFTPVEPTWRPRVAHDVIAAWDGVRPDRPGERLRVTAAAWDGKPVLFDTTDDAPTPPTSQSIRWGGPGSQFAFVLLTILALLGAAILARWNIHQGRWDRAGALKLAGIVFGVGLVQGLLRADHVPIARDEYLLFARIASWYLYSAAFTFLVYVAFEPFVRQRWPRVLTSWTRLLSGRVGDPLVGQDILIGTIAGVAITLVREGEFIASRWFGLAAPAPFASTLDGLGTWRHFASLSLFVPLEALSLALGWLLILLIVRIVCRGDTLATVATVILVLPILILPGNHLVLEFSNALLIAALSVFVLRRFGLFALVVEISIANVLTRLPITMSAADWYVGRSALVLLGLAALVAHGFHSALAGRQLFGRSFVES